MCLLMVDMNIVSGWFRLPKILWTLLLSHRKDAGRFTTSFIRLAMFRYRNFLAILCAFISWWIQIYTFVHMLIHKYIYILWNIECANYKPNDFICHSSICPYLCPLQVHFVQLHSNVSKVNTLWKGFVSHFLLSS